MSRFFYFSVLFTYTLFTIQADANKSVGSGGDYADLTAAFIAVNSGLITGAIVFRLISSTHLTQSAELNASGVEAASFTSVLIYPDVAGITISSAQTFTIRLNGADNVTIDGRVDQEGNSDLIISNSSSAASSATISLFAGANNNKVRYCKLKGASPSTTGGVVVFYGTSALTGSSNNLIEFNDITNNDGIRPLYAINSVTATESLNSGNTIRNNNIFNTINLSSAWESNAIKADGNNSSMTVTGNSFYEETELVPSNTLPYTFIKVTNSNNTDITITGNYIGGSEPLCGGTKMIKSSANANTFTGINLLAGSSIINNIQGNTISNISWSNSGNSNFIGIYARGFVDIGTTTGNVIGNTADTGSIFFENATTGGTFYGIYATGTLPVSISDNCIGSVTVGNADATAATNFRGIDVSVSAIFSVTDNIIGNANQSNSIKLTSGSTSNIQTATGISCNGASAPNINTISNNLIANIINKATASNSSKLTGITADGAGYTISHNYIHNLTVSTLNTSISNTAALTGISLISYLSITNSVTNNTVHDLTNTNPAFTTGAVSGIYFYCESTKGHLASNKIYNLSVDPASTDAFLRGIIIANGTLVTYNNMISISSLNSSRIYGIFEQADATEHYYNSILITGTQSDVFNHSIALYSNPSVSTKIKNNILVNSRSRTGGVSKHSAIRIDSNPAIEIDYNNYYVTGTGGQVGLFGTDAQTLAGWRILTGQDTHSKNKQIFFADSTSDLHLTGSSVGDFDLTGIPLVDFTADFDGNTRSSQFPYIGADEITDSPLPVELVSFTATLKTTAVKLNWETKSEIDNYGFEIERKSSSSEWIKIGFIEGHGTSNSPKYYSFNDEKLLAGNYKYRLKQLDNNGAFEYSEIVSVAFGAPSGFSLSQNFPNPFNPETVINYSTEFPSLIKIEIFEPTGTRIVELISDYKDAGHHSIKIDAIKLGLSSGVYFYKLSATGIDGKQFSATKKFVLMK